MAPGRSRSSRKGKDTASSSSSPTKHAAPSSNQDTSPSQSASNSSSAPLTLGQKYLLQLITARGYVQKEEMEGIYDEMEELYGMGSEDLNQW